MVTETIEEMREGEKERENYVPMHHMYIYNVNGVVCKITCG